MVIIKNDQIFIQLEPKMTVKPNQSIKIKDVASVACYNEKVKEDVLNLKIVQSPDDEDGIVIFALDIIEKIKVKYENLDIITFGKPEILVYSKEDKKEDGVLQILKIIVVCILLFVGAGLTIMDFHEDVNMEEVHKTIYYLMTGEKSDNLLILQIPYSFGIGLGMVTFFNHMFKKKKKKEPSPMEIEMYTYDRSLDDYILDQMKRVNNEK